MADRGYTIEGDLKKINIALNVPAFLDGRDQLDEDEVLESQSIASVRIHVECLMSRLKHSALLRQKFPLTMHGNITQVWTVCCLLCNFMDPFNQLWKSSITTSLPLKSGVEKQNDHLPKGGKDWALANFTAFN